MVVSSNTRIQFLLFIIRSSFEWLCYFCVVLCSSCYYYCSLACFCIDFCCWSSCLLSFAHFIYHTLHPNTRLRFCPTVLEETAPAISDLHTKHSRSPVHFACELKRKHQKATTKHHIKRIFLYKLWMKEEKCENWVANFIRLERYKKNVSFPQTHTHTTQQKECNSNAYCSIVHTTDFIQWNTFLAT